MTSVMVASSIGRWSIGVTLLAMHQSPRCLSAQLIRKIPAAARARNDEVWSMSRTTEHLDHHVWFGNTECLPPRIVAEQYAYWAMKADP
jgi:hypothetical protein